MRLFTALTAVLAALAFAVAAPATGASAKSTSACYDVKTLVKALLEAPKGAEPRQILLSTLHGKDKSKQELELITKSIGTLEPPSGDQTAKVKLVFDKLKTLCKELK